MYDVRIPLLGKYIVLCIRTQQWFEVRTHDLSGRPIAAHHNLTFPLSWVQKVSYRSKRQSGRAVYRHLALLCLLYCIPDAALSLFSPSLFVSVVARFVPVLLACWRRKLLLNPTYFRLSVVAVAAVFIFFTNQSAPGLFLVWSPIQNPFAVLIGGVSKRFWALSFFFWYTQDAESPEVLVCVCRVWLPGSASSPCELWTSRLKFGSWFGRNLSCYIFEQRGSFVFVLYCFFGFSFFCFSRSITRATA